MKENEDATAQVKEEFYMLTKIFEDQLQVLKEEGITRGLFHESVRLSYMNYCTCTLIHFWQI